VFASRQHETIAKIYETIADGRVWGDALRCVAEDLRAEKSVIYTFNTNFDDAAYVSTISAEMGGLWVFHGVDESAADRYSNHFANVDPFIGAAKARGIVDGRILTNDDSLTSDELYRSEFYNDFWRPLGIEYAMTAPDAPRWHGLAPTVQTIMYRGKSRAAFDRRSMQEFEFYRVHIRRALSLKMAMGRNAQAAARRAVVASIGQPAISIDRDLNVLAMNAPADEICRNAGYLKISRGRLMQTPSNRPLLELLAEQFASRGNGSSTMTADRGPDGHLRCVYQVLPVDLPWPDTERSGHIVIILHLRNRPPGIDWRAVRTAFGLTGAEVRIGALLLDGKRVEEIAELLRITRETARTHMKRLLHKAGTKRQVDFIRLMLMMFGPK